MSGEKESIRIDESAPYQRWPVVIVTMPSGAQTRWQSDHARDLDSLIDQLIYVALGHNQPTPAAIELHHTLHDLLKPYDEKQRGAKGHA